MSELENIDNVEDLETIPTDNTTEDLQENVEQSTGEVSGEVSGEVPEDNSAEIEAEQERLRREHEALLNSFPETTVFYDRIIETDTYKCLGSWTKSAYTADSMGFLDNNMDESELTFVPNNKELTSGIYYIKGHEKPESTIEELKVKKLAEISAEAHKYSQYECENMYLTSSKGFKINADRKAQDNLKGLIGIGLTCKFKDYDNEFHPGTTVEDLNVMLLECYQNGALMYQKKFDYEAQVANAQSKDDLNFDVVFEMADFSDNN